MARSSSASDQMTLALPTWEAADLNAPLDRREKTKPIFVLDLCVLTVELSGAHAVV
jgi:hypothetical protein